MIIKKYRIVLGILGWGALFFSFLLSALHVPGINVNNPFGPWNKFSFYTVQTNIFISLWFILSLRKESGVFVSYPWKTAFAVYIAVTGIIFGVFLSSYLNGLPWYIWILSLIMHYILPAGFILDWALFPSKESLKVRHIFLFLIYPCCYGAYTVIFGILTEWYPYPMIDIKTLGGMAGGRNYLFFLGFFLLLNCIFFGISKLKRGKPG